MATIDDIRAFLKEQNVFAVEKELQMFFQRFDRDEKGFITRQDFISGMSPFMNGSQ